MKNTVKANEDNDLKYRIGIEDEGDKKKNPDNHLSESGNQTDELQLFTE